MPSVIATPATFAITWGSVVSLPARLSGTGMVLTLSMGVAVAGPGLGSGVTNDLRAVTDTLFAGEAIVDAQGRPSRRFQQIWQNTIEALVSVLTSQGASITELEAIYAGINAAQATAATAVQTANSTQSSIDLTNSYTNPVGVGTAASNGTVTISAHSRVYPASGTSVAVNSGTVTGFSAGSYVTVYYNDPARTGGAVTYIGTTGAVSQTGDTHIVWQGAIPSAGQTDNTGIGPTAPGYFPPDPIEYDPRLYEYEQQF